MSYQEHQQHASRAVGCALITVSDTRTEATDTSGRTIRELLEAAGHAVRQYAVVKDEPAQIRERIAAAVADEGCRAVLINGGTGISTRDRTFEAVAGLLEKRIDGFGELFRMLSFAEIGSGAMLSRAVGGVYQGRVIFCMPGSTNAVRLAMEKLILPELGHLVWEMERQG
jgi:molybdenum cofactor biosynthesis protein B